jgi:uncharacterized repeat protein (TIGR03803 family)
MLHAQMTEGSPMKSYLVCLFLCLTTTVLFSQSETVLYNFTGGSDGGLPEGRLTSYGGNFYGTTYIDGLWGYGTVFEVSPNGSGGWNETVLYSFTGKADGGNPNSSYVVFDSLGNLYGTTQIGGLNSSACSAYAGYNCGVVFELLPNGSGGWTEAVLHSFANDPDGANPINGLIMDAVGNLYGVTEYGGIDTGTVFELSSSGGGWTERVIYTIPSSSNIPTSGLAMDAAGNIFGATYRSVFELSPNGSGGWNPSVIHKFPNQVGTGGGEGFESTPVLDPAGNIYGASCYGGASKQGTVYKLTLQNGTWRYKVLYPFKVSPDGNCPNGIVFDKAGNIYGTTLRGGNGQGTVFELTPVKNSYKEKVLWRFSGPDGYAPFSGVILDNGNLYGTTLYGTACYGSPSCANAGDVFEVIP